MKNKITLIIAVLTIIITQLIIVNDKPDENISTEIVDVTNTKKIAKSIID